MDEIITVEVNKGEIDETLRNAIEILKDTYKQLLRNIVETLFPQLKAILEIYQIVCVFKRIRRISHLALHAKKQRTRKKNIHRLCKLLQDLGMGDFD